MITATVGLPERHDDPYDAKVVALKVAVLPHQPDNELWQTRYPFHFVAFYGSKGLRHRGARKCLPPIADRASGEKDNSMFQIPA